MNKIYFDAKRNFEVIDVSGKKTLEQVNSEFEGNFIDVTAERNIKIIQDRENLKSQLNQEKIDFSKLMTSQEQIDFIAKKLNLK